MKNLVYVFAFFLIIACKSNHDKEVSAEENSSENTSIELNILVPDEEDGGEMLLGIINRKGLEGELFEAWFDENYQGHILDTATVQAIKPLLKDVTLKVFLGSWCDDSQREVPALFKILDATDYNYNRLELIAVTHNKDTPQGYETDFDIEYVPTIIISRNGEVLNRIVEYPQMTLEKDMLTILQGEPYKHVYED
ncbi:MAG: thioredoxin [Bacteroidetes bacterium]|nr:MAG: thioredoxin [Bacteroidota bacterium]